MKAFVGSFLWACAVAFGMEGEWVHFAVSAGVGTLLVVSAFRDALSVGRVL
ncbi:hypothetical protein [Coralloluteibacterium thermophilus]|uniref:Uncharacterized protein n=1 Tax=Coralloluteibacterium thermophilum TaxID=2707049 RepID=A0ABV9NLN4_9GAMM